MWFEIQSIDLAASCSQNELNFSDHYNISFEVKHQNLIGRVQLSSGQELHQLEGLFEVRRRETLSPSFNSDENNIVGQLSFNGGYGHQGPSYDAWLEISAPVFDRIWTSEAGGLRCIAVELAVSSLNYDREKMVELWDIDAHKHLSIESCKFHFERRRKKRM